MFARVALAWIGILVLAILNGALRQGLLIPRFGEHVGHIVSTLLLSILVLAAAWVLMPWVRPLTVRDAWFIGLLWLVLTLAFEFLGGHYLFGSPWERLLADYNVAQGRIWVLVLISTLLAPVLVHALRRPTACIGSRPDEVAFTEICAGVHTGRATLSLQPSEQTIW